MIEGDVMWFCGSVNVIKYSLSLPYLSPVVLRKELEMLMEQHGEDCLNSSRLVDNHAVIFWNLASVSVFFFSFVVIVVDPRIMHKIFRNYVQKISKLYRSALADCA